MLMIYAGPASGLEPFATPFRTLNPARELVYTSVAYPDLFTLNRNDEASPATCGKGLYRHLMPNYLARHNTTALRTVHTLFNNITAQYPAIGFTSVYVIESYSQQAVTAVRDHDTATPYRDYPLLAYVNLLVRNGQTWSQADQESNIARPSGGIRTLHIRLISSPHLGL